MAELGDDFPVTRDQITLALAILTNEIVAACSLTSKEADQRLEDIAGRLLTFVDSATPGPITSIIQGIATDLIGSEENGL